MSNPAIIPILKLTKRGHRRAAAESRTPARHRGTGLHGADRLLRPAEKQITATMANEIEAIRIFCFTIRRTAKPAYR